MAKKFHKLFLDSSIAFRDLTWSAREVWVFLHSLEVKDDGTLAFLKSDEEPYQAIARTHGVPVRSRRRYRAIVPELIEAGFLVVHDGRVTLANWQARQAWFRGELAPPFQGTSTTEAGHERDRSETAARPQRDTSATVARPWGEANEPESFKADSESTTSQRRSGSGSGSGLRAGRSRPKRDGQSESDEALESELDLPSENRHAETPQPQVAEPTEQERDGFETRPPPARPRSAAPQGSAEWCREELDRHNPVDVKLFEEGAR